MNLAEAVYLDQFAEARAVPVNPCPYARRDIIVHQRREVPYEVDPEKPARARKRRRDSKAGEREQAIVDALAAGPMRYTPCKNASGIKDPNGFHTALARLVRSRLVLATGKQGSKVYALPKLPGAAE